MHDHRELLTVARRDRLAHEVVQADERVGEIERDIVGHREDIRDDIAPRLKALREDNTKLQIEEGTATIARARHLEGESRHERVEAKPPISCLLSIVQVEDTVERVRNRVAVAVEDVGALLVAEEEAVEA